LKLGLFLAGLEDLIAGYAYNYCRTQKGHHTNMIVGGVNNFAAVIYNTMDMIGFLWKLTEMSSKKCL
jgi:hypothetical protein